MQPSSQTANDPKRSNLFAADNHAELEEPQPARRTKLVGLILGPALFLITSWLPLDLTFQQHRLLSLILLIVTFWITRALPIPITSILALALAVVLDVGSSDQVFSAFSSPTLFLIIGGFIMTQAIIKYGLGRRIALRVLSVPGIAQSTYRIIIAFGALSALLSGVMDNGALAAMLLPIAAGLIHTLDDDIRAQSDRTHGKNLRFGTALMLMTAYGPTLGSLLTPFGDASNLVGWRFIRDEFDIAIPVGSWMALSVPIVIVLFVLMATAVLLLNRPEVSRLPYAHREIFRHRKEQGSMSRGEINTAICFCLAILFWLLPPIIGLFAGYSSDFYNLFVARLDPAVVAVFFASLLFIIPVGNGHATLKWKDTTSMDWGPILLMGSGLALGNLMAETGLAEVMGLSLTTYTQHLGPYGVYTFSAATAITMSELTSNLVSVSVLVPIVPIIAETGGGSGLVAALIATFAAVYGFMLPISTSANAIIYSSGKVPFKQMVKTGALVDASGVLIVTGGVLLMLRLTGIAG